MIGSNKSVRAKEMNVESGETSEPRTDSLREMVTALVREALAAEWGGPTGTDSLGSATAGPDNYKNISLSNTGMTGCQV